jgi:putative serine protease PepD
VAFRIPFLGVVGVVKYVGPPGAKIDRIVADGPAGAAGLKGGDLIVEFGGETVTTFDELRRLIFARTVGEKVTVKVRRGDETLDLEAILGELPNS